MPAHKATQTSPHPQPNGRGRVVGSRRDLSRDGRQQLVSLVAERPSRREPERHEPQALHLVLAVVAYLDRLSPVGAASR